MAENDENIVAKLARYAASGIGPLCSAKELAREYEANPKYRTADERIEALIAWETSKSFTTGFVTGLGGLPTLPLAIPAALGATWIVQARLAVAIANLSGYDSDSDQVRSMAVWALLGDAAKEIVKQAGIQIGRKVGQKAVENMSARLLMEVNKKVGFRLITKAGEKSILSFSRMVPIAGGLIGGSMDAASTRVVGRAARRLFPIHTEPDPPFDSTAPRAPTTGSAASAASSQVEDSKRPS
jgi:hypothetical protein